MNDKIIIALRRHHHCEKARDVLRQNNLPYPVFEIEEDDVSYSALKRVLPADACVLVTGDVYAGSMMEQLNLAVVTIRRSRVPFAESIRRALQLGHRAALIWRETDSTAAQQACLKFGDSVAFYPIKSKSSPEDIARLFVSLLASDIQVVIGTATLNELAEKHGLQVVNVPYDDEDILSAIHLAEHNVRFMEQLRQVSETLNTIQDNIAEGIIALNEAGFITTINSPASDILNGGIYQLTGMHITRTALSCREVSALLKSFEPFSNKILFVKGVSVALSGQPIVIQGKYKGAVLTLTPVEQIQRTEQIIRARMNAQAGKASVSFQDIIGQSRELEKAIRIAQQYARVDSSILINGESGTGKEMFVQSIHNAGSRCNEPFVVINCAALPENLIESELFGYEKGAFTGALSNGKQGLFERGHKGTIFLDEISEMPLHVQARFLRVLQERTVTPIGGNRVIPVDIRIIAATNRDLKEMVRRKEFREDLYYRISVLTMSLPPLRDRGNDIALLTEHFIKIKNQSLSLSIKGAEPQAIAYLQALAYPGNIRQLSNIVERAMVLCTGEQLDLAAVMAATTDMEHVPPESQTLEAAPHNWRHITHATDAIQQQTIRDALAQCGGNRSATAKMLGISPSTLYRYMKKMQLFS